MKTFRQHLNESDEVSKVNEILRKYINGDTPDRYENLQPNVRDLFKQIIDLFDDNGIQLQILKDGEPFDGRNIVINTDRPMHLELEADTSTPYKLHVEIKRNPDTQDYFFSALKVETK